MLRTLLAVGVAVASWSLATPPASAVCNLTLYELTGYCSHCQIIGVPYGIADAATGDRVLPDLICPA